MSINTSGELIKKEKAEMEKARILREKGWDELKVDEKMERMREIVKQNNIGANRQLLDLSKVVSKFENHSHKDNGDIVIPFQDKGFGLGMGEVSSGMKPEKIYF